MPAMVMEKIIDDLLVGLAPLTFGPPVTHTYNPLTYARNAHRAYFNRFGRPGIKAMLVGMNPGPWGMAQTGIPFGDVGFVREWMGIHETIGVPDTEHPKRPIQGFNCLRGEVSGRRLWGWAKARFGTPETFFSAFWVANYCPLVFMEKTGRNRTPDKLAKSEKAALFHVCDHALKQTVAWFKPSCVIGVGNFATQRVQRALAGMAVTVGRVTHPSPANPTANQGWDKHMDQTITEMGLSI